MAQRRATERNEEVEGNKKNAIKRVRRMDMEDKEVATILATTFFEQNTPPPPEMMVIELGAKPEMVVEVTQPLKIAEPVAEETETVAESVKIITMKIKIPLVMLPPSGSIPAAAATTTSLTATSKKRAARARVKSTYKFVNAEMEFECKSHGQDEKAGTHDQAIKDFVEKYINGGKSTGKKNMCGKDKRALFAFFERVNLEMCITTGDKKRFNFIKDGSVQTKQSIESLVKYVDEEVRVLRSGG